MAAVVQRGLFGENSRSGAEGSYHLCVILSFTPILPSSIPSSAQYYWLVKGRAQAPLTNQKLVCELIVQVLLSLNFQF